MDSFYSERETGQRGNFTRIQCYRDYLDSTAEDEFTTAENWIALSNNMKMNRFDCFKLCDSKRLSQRQLHAVTSSSRPLPGCGARH